MDASISTEPNGAMASVTPSYRRNGKLFSCEPCRKGKLRCDHNSPVCGRCARRNKPDQCIYHPAPLTKARSPPTPGVQKSTGPRSRPPSVQNSTLALQRPLDGLVSPPLSTGAQESGDAFMRPLRGGELDYSANLASPGLTSIGPPTSQERHAQTSSSASYASPGSSMTFREPKVGFLGATSYNAVFTENPVTLGPVEEPEESEHVPTLPPVPPDKIETGAEVLALLRDIPLYEKFSQRWFDLCDGVLIMRPAYRIWIDELWAEWGQLLTTGNADQLRSLSELVWRNTRKPMKIHSQMTAREWARSASGRGLRWEIVGIILSFAGLIAVNLSNWDAIFDSIRHRYVDRATFAERMRKASEYCLCFCYECEVLNEIYISFMYEDLILVECLKGDAHYAAWQRTGEVCDAIVAMGLHQGNRVDANTPFWLAELRKKIFISCYGRDKVVATFLGRPPRLSYRYCKMEEPLDLSDDELFLEGADLDAVLGDLDQNGWNTCGRLNRNTWLRVWFQHCRVREDILEIALGSEDDDVTQRGEQIRQRLKRLNSSYPEFMKITPEEVMNQGDGSFGRASGLGFAKSEKHMRQVNAIFSICIHAGIAHTHFLLQRAMINRRKGDYKELIPISRRILSMVLLAQSRRDFFRDFQGDLIYLLTVHGLPNAGVLAIELLKQEQSRQYTLDVLPRSETIQDLSVFISALAAVGPGEGNFSVCNQGRKSLKRVLDQILSPQSAPVTSSEQQPFDEMSLYFPTANDADFLHWLENVEWDKPSYVTHALPQGEASQS